MRLLVNAVGAVMGGAARHLGPFMAALVAAEPGWEYEVWVTGSSAELGLQGEGVVVRARERTGSAGYLGWCLWGIGRRAEAMGADCVLNLTNHGPLARSVPVPSVLYQRNTLYFDPGWVRRMGSRQRLAAAARRALAFRSMRVAEVVVTPTDAMGRWLRAWPLSPPFVQVTVPHAVDLGRFRYRPRPLRSLEDVRLLVVSHAAWHKGMDTAVRLAAGLGRRGRLALTVDGSEGSGDPAYYRMLARLAHDLGVADRVEFLGPVSDVGALYREADVVLVPSITESFGFPLLEAMACGVPVLASSIPASLEVGGGCCTWFRPGDPGHALEQLGRLAAMAEGDALDLLGRARRRAESFSWERNAGAVADLVRACAAT